MTPIAARTGWPTKLGGVPLERVSPPATGAADAVDPDPAGPAPDAAAAGAAAPAPGDVDAPGRAAAVAGVWRRAATGASVAPGAPRSGGAARPGAAIAAVSASASAGPASAAAVRRSMPSRQGERNPGITSGDASTGVAVRPRACAPGRSASRGASSGGASSRGAASRGAASGPKEPPRTHMGVDVIAAVSDRSWPLRAGVTVGAAETAVNGVVHNGERNTRGLSTIVHIHPH